MRSVKNMLFALLACGTLAAAQDKKAPEPRIINHGELPPNIIINGPDGQPADNVIIQVIEGDGDVPLVDLIETLRNEQPNMNGVVGNKRLIIRGGNWEGQTIPNNPAHGKNVESPPQNVPVPNIAPEDVPLPRIGLKSFSVGRQAILTGDGVQQGRPSIRMVWYLEIQQPLVLNTSGYMTQTLDLLDSKGKKVGDVPMNIYGNQRTNSLRNGKRTTWHSSYAYEFKLNDSPWYCVKGELKVPVCVLEKTEPYELPLVAGAELAIIPPDMDNKAGFSDIVVSGENQDKVYIEKTEQVVVNGEKNCRVELFFDNTSGSMVDKIELTDEKGKPLAGRKTVSEGKQKHLFLLPPALDGQNIHFRVVYKKHWKNVVIPVNLKLDIWGSMVE